MTPTPKEKAIKFMCREFAHNEDIHLMIRGLDIALQAQRDNIIKWCKSRKDCNYSKLIKYLKGEK